MSYFLHNQPFYISNKELLVRVLWFAVSGFRYKGNTKISTTVMKVKSLWNPWSWKLWNLDLRPFSRLKRVMNFVSTGLGCHFWYVCDNIEMFWSHRSLRRAAASQTCCLQRATWDSVGCWLLEGLLSGWLCLSEAWTRCEYPEEVRPTAYDNKTTAPQSFVACFFFSSSSSYEVFLLRLFKFAKVQEFSSSSVFFVRKRPFVSSYSQLSTYRLWWVGRWRSYRL